MIMTQMNTKELAANQHVVIRRAVAGDLPAIMRIYDAARQFMRSQGNATQWSGGYPSTN